MTPAAAEEEQKSASTSPLGGDAAAVAAQDTKALADETGSGPSTQSDETLAAKSHAGPASGQLIAVAETEAARTSTDDAPLGQPGQPMNRRSPYFVGLLGAAGVATTYGLVQLLIGAREVLILIGLSLFLAIGLDPAVRKLTRRVPRAVAVTAVTLAMLAVVGGFLAAAIPPLVTQSAQLVQHLPKYLSQLQDRSSFIGRLNERFQLKQHVEAAVASSGQGLFGGLLGAGQMVLSATAATGTVLVLTIYFLADLPRIRQLIYRLIPNSRRPRAILIGDEMFAKVGGFVLGNLLTSLIAGIGTFVWLLIFGVPYPLLLAIMVALLDLIPIIGSTVGGIIVSLIALSVSLQVALATVAFYIVFRLAEDYLLVPKILGKVVEVPATVTFVAVLLGGAMLGIIGALIAIPVAAAARLILQETVFPRLDRS
jgi:predicted PurR-regulated permease PerM